MELKTIPIEDYPDLVEMIENMYNGGRVYDATVHSIMIMRNEIDVPTGVATVHLDLTIDVAPRLTSSFHINLDEDDSVAKKLREIYEGIACTGERKEPDPDEAKELLERERRENRQIWRALGREASRIRKAAALKEKDND